MKIYIGSDHGGWELKNRLLDGLAESGAELIDCGDREYRPEDDYPKFAYVVAKSVSEDDESFGILICRSGEGMEMVANKVCGVRAALVWKPNIARETRQDNDANVLVLPADYLSEDESLEIVRTFLATTFSNEPRHIRRLMQLSRIERGEV